MESCYAVQSHWDGIDHNDVIVSDFGDGPGYRYEIGVIREKQVISPCKSIIFKLQKGFKRIEYGKNHRVELMNLKQDKIDALKDAANAAIASNIRHSLVLETILEKVSEIPALDHLTADKLADALQNLEVDVGTLLSVLIRARNEEDLLQMDHTLVRRRIDRIDEFGF